MVYTSKEFMLKKSESITPIKNKNKHALGDRAEEASSTSERFLKIKGVFTTKRARNIDISRVLSLSHYVSHLLEYNKCDK